MKTLYLDLVSGISGDMFVGALLDLGVRLHQLERGLAGLGIGGYHLHAGHRSRNGIVGTKFDVHLEAEHSHTHDDRVGEVGDPHSHPHQAHSHSHSHHEHSHSHADHGPSDSHHGEALHAALPRSNPAPADFPGPAHGEGTARDFNEIRRLITAGALPDWVKDTAVRVFARIATAEGKIHGTPPHAVHFHEVGALDSLVDIVGACLALDLLGRPRLLASPVVDGTGWVQCAHGRFPVPTPATLEILGARGIAVSQCDEPQELVTPTGAALLAELVADFGPLRQFRAERIGYGVGTRENRTRPNILRVLLGEVVEGTGADHDWETDQVIVLETNLDDINPELLGQVVSRALEAGALDAFHTPVQMKKDRPGVLLTVLARVADADALTLLLLHETSAFGVRRTAAERRKLRREFRTVTTPFGTVPVKVGLLDGRVLQAAPEFEDCRRLAGQAKVPVRTVFAAAQAEAWQFLRASESTATR